jgi:hypothetical protein
MEWFGVWGWDVFGFLDVGVVLMVGCVEGLVGCSWDIAIGSRVFLFVFWIGGHYVGKEKVWWFK